MDLDSLSAWSAGLGAPFTTSQAHAQGATDRVLAHLVALKVWRKLGRGLFVSGQVWEAADARGRHRLVVAGRLSFKDARWVAARRSAAVFHDLPLLGDVPAVPQLLRGFDGTKSKGKNRHERIATFTDTERVEIEGVAASYLARTVGDIARQEEFRSGLIVADGALRRGLSQEELLAMARRCIDWPGGLNALKVAKLANGLHETPLESLSWAAAHTLGIPMPEPQIRIYVGERRIARADGLWRQFNTIGQADGLFKYKDRDAADSGISNVMLKAGDDEAAKIIVRGKGDGLGLTPLNVGQLTSVLVQLIGTDACWEAHYTSGGNNPGEFRADAD